MKIAYIALSTVLLQSCSHRLVGTWNVNRYETSTPNQAGVSLMNIGTFTFERDNSGAKNLNYSLLHINKVDNFPFRWNWEDNKFVTLVGDNSDFNKTWIIMENSRKKQLWKSTDGGITAQTIELEKLKKKK